MTRFSVHGLLPLLALTGCAQPAPLEQGPAPPTARGSFQVVVVSSRDPVPEGGDGSPLHTLAFERPDGERRSIGGEARAFVPFRDGVALVDAQGALQLVSIDGSRRTLARVSGAPPAVGPQGQLYYVAAREAQAELHVLSREGQDRVLATGIANAGVLSPQSDGRLFFVAARRGGVAGLWMVPPSGRARCLTNCSLGRGPWGDAFIPLPTDGAAIVGERDSGSYQAADGSRRTVDLASRERSPAQVSPSPSAETSSGLQQGAP